MKWTTPVFTLLAALSASLCSQAQAEDHALVIAVSEYQDGSTLEGVEQDPRMMRDVLRKMNFKDSQIRVLENRAATKRGILDAIQSWLVQGVKPTDRVILYYSGHGTRSTDRNGDEEDGCDEALIPYDLDNLLVDDELDAALSRIPATEVLVILDSCFSGTATKSRITGRTTYGKRVQAKVLRKDGLVCDRAVNINKASRRQGVFEAPRAKPEGNTSAALSSGRIEFTAAAANEVAITAEGGSLFTVALHERVMDAQGPVSFAELREYSAQAIRTKLAELGGQEFLAYTPQLSGPQNMLASDFFQFGRLQRTAPRPVRSIESVTSGRALMDRYLNTSSFAVEVKSNAQVYRVGDPIRYDVFSPNNGYLNLLELDDEGNVAVLFPNRYNQNNRVVGGKVYSLPSSDLGNFELKAIAPAGKSRVVALVSEEPLNLYTDVPSRTDGPFRVLLNVEELQKMAKLMKATGVMPLPTGTVFGAGSVDIEVR